VAVLLNIISAVFSGDMSAAVPSISFVICGLFSF